MRTDPDLGDAYDVVADTTRVQLLDIVRGLDFAPFDPPDLAARSVRDGAVRNIGDGLCVLFFFWGGGVDHGWLLLQ